MPIPEFDKNGNLPPGEHSASWEEIMLRYGYNAQRRKLLARLKEWLNHMRAAGCRKVYLNGSLVCAKEIPGDYDACWDTRGVDAARLDRTLLLLDERGVVDIREKFGGDIRPELACPPGSIRAYVDIFKRDRNGNAKGVVVIDLGEKRP